MAFYVFLAAQLAGVCTLDEIEGVDDEWEVGRGISRSAGWPDDAVMRMSSMAKKNVGLADSLFAPGVRVVSARVRAAIEAAGEKQVEFLPVTILNHKKRVASKDYFVVNPIRIVDCIDEAASQVRWNSIDPTFMSGVKQLVLRPDQVPADAHVFRPKGWPQKLIIRKALADDMTKKGYTGFYFLDPLQYRG